MTRHACAMIVIDLSPLGGQSASGTQAADPGTENGISAISAVLSVSITVEAHHGPREALGIRRRGSARVTAIVNVLVQDATSISHLAEEHAI